jgi:hypothetical protein
VALQGNYGADVERGDALDGDGAALSRSDRFRFRPRPRSRRFRSGESDRRVVGGGAMYTLRPDLRLAADAMLYRQRSNGRPAEGPWNQRRASVRLEWSVGTDPGAVARGAERGRTP